LERTTAPTCTRFRIDQRSADAQSAKLTHTHSFMHRYIVGWRTTKAKRHRTLRIVHAIRIGIKISRKFLGWRFRHRPGLYCTPRHNQFWIESIQRNHQEALSRRWW
jgi:hypothetical protein